MARASSIWIITDPHREVIAAFTVHHEMLTWLNGLDSESGLEGWEVVKAPDNPRSYYAEKRWGRWAARELLS